MDSRRDDAMTDLGVTDVRVFVPAKDFAMSKAFYVALGWELRWEQGPLAELELGGHRFLLQDYYDRAWAENFMLHVCVADAQAWHDHVTALLARGAYGSARVGAPREEGYGALVTHVWDPSGVLLHFAQPRTGNAH